MAKYSITDRIVLTDSGGRTLIAETLEHAGTFTATNTIGSLSPDYFTNYFAAGGNQGETSGYAVGGAHPPSPLDLDTIDKFPFSSDANATDVGNLTLSRFQGRGASSTAHGYAAGGRHQTPTDTNGHQNIIDKFSFSSDGNATDVGDLSNNIGGQSSAQDRDHGYMMGGFGANYYEVDKFPFASDANATNIGNMNINANDTTGISAPSHAYMSAGRLGFPSTTTTAQIRKSPFASLTSVTSVGDGTAVRNEQSGTQSSTHGYTHGGQLYPPGVALNIIDKFPFSSDTDATDVGDLVQAMKWTAGSSSTNHGYKVGGEFTNSVEKYTFASDNNATDVGDLTQTRAFIFGNHQA